VGVWERGRILTRTKQEIAAPNDDSRVEWTNTVIALFVLIATGIGAFPRLYFALGSTFPLNDGGLFYVMIRDLQAANYILPTLTTYNSAGIPFAYPPLGLYVSGFLSDWFRWPLLDVMRLMPPLVSVATIPIFYGLAHSLCNRTSTALYALFTFALLPIGFDWIVMGGGVTRSLGVLFAIITLHQALRLFTRPQRRYIFTTGVAAGLTVLSHLGFAWFAAYSAGLLFIFMRPGRQQAYRALLALFVALAVLAPWLWQLGHQIGVQPLLAAWQSNGLSWWSLVTPVFFLFTNEPLIDLAAVLGLLGLLSCLRDREPLLPIWLGLIFLLQTRAAPTVAILPFALLVGKGLNDVVMPGLSHVVRLSDQAPRQAPVTHVAPRMLIAYLVTTGLISAYLTAPKASLPEDQRMAMNWVRVNTPAAGRFAVITNISDSGSDMVSEWFPALTQRVSLATPQGLEWLPNDRYQQYLRVYEQFEQCAKQTVSCLAPLLPTGKGTPVYIYVTVDDSLSDDGLLTSLSQSPEYSLVYAEPRVHIFERQ
jgi:hypothetical protein